LISLKLGQTVMGCLRPNPEFKPDNRKTPLILIGAGTGIGPLAGFIRAQGAQRPIHLWSGARHPDTDFLYADELSQWSDEGRLSSLHTAFSRSGQCNCVQDALRQDAQSVRDLVANGAKIMVCGGRDMGDGVRQAIIDVLAPLGDSATNLKLQGRYAEDVY
jgi:sulfite reductase (NADPH) flavoprotein alpha-component